MSAIIKLLEQMGSDATLNNEHDTTALLANTDISNSQQQAILAKDVTLLTETIADLPVIKCFAIVPAEDDDQGEDEQEDHSSETSNQLVTAIAANL